MVRFLICLLSSVAMLLMFPGSVATFPKETFRLTSSYICPKNLFPLASTSLYWSRWLKKKWQTCNRYSMGSWLRQVKSEDSVRGLPDQYNNHMEYSLFKVHLSRYLWSNKTAFFPHDKYFKAKISKSHIKTAYIVFLGRTKNFPHLKV